MTEQAQAAALADAVRDTADAYMLTDGGFAVYFNKAEWSTIESALRLLAATPAASFEARQRGGRAIYEAPGRQKPWGNLDDAMQEAFRHQFDTAISTALPGDRLPNGVLVPEEPSDAQIAAMDQILDEMRETSDGWPVSDVVTLYKAAIAAAKTPE